MKASLALAVAGSAMLLASAAAAQHRGDPGTRTDDDSCYALALAAQEAADGQTAPSGARYGDGGVTPQEREFLERCGPKPGRYYVEVEPEPEFVDPSWKDAPEPIVEAYPVYKDVVEPETVLITNGPVPDTPANRARLGGPDSFSGRRTAPRGN